MRLNDRLLDWRLNDIEAFRHPIRLALSVSNPEDWITIDLPAGRTIDPGFIALAMRFRLLVSRLARITVFTLGIPW